MPRAVWFPGLTGQGGNAWGEPTLIAAAQATATSSASAHLIRRRAARGVSVAASTSTGQVSTAIPTPYFDYQWPSPSPRIITGGGTAGGVIDLKIGDQTILAAASVDLEGNWSYSYSGDPGVYEIVARTRYHPGEVDYKESAWTVRATFTIAGIAGAALQSPPPAPLSDNVIDRVRRTASPEWPLMLVELQHKQLASPVRIVNDTDKFESQGLTYVALPCEIVPPDDQDQVATRSSIRLDNTGRELIEWVDISGGGKGASIRLIQVLPSTPDSHDFIIDLDVLSVNVDSQYVTLELGVENIYDRALCLFTYRPETHPGIA